MYEVEQLNGQFDVYKVNSKGRKFHVSQRSTKLEAYESALVLANFDLKSAQQDYLELKKKIDKS